jgi:hypothetical protein
LPFVCSADDAIIDTPPEQVALVMHSNYRGALVKRWLGFVDSDDNVLDEGYFKLAFLTLTSLLVFQLSIDHDMGVPIVLIFLSNYQPIWCSQVYPTQNCGCL